MQKTKPVSELQVGDFIVRIGRQQVDASLQAVNPVSSGATASGPRGGRYELLGDSWVALVTSAGVPVVKRTAFATVEIAEEW